MSDRRRLAPAARTLADELLALEQQIDEALAAEIDFIQIRERDAAPAAVRDLVRRCASRAAGAARLVVNDRADVAYAGGAAGVHLPSDGPAVAAVRAIGPSGWVVGRSIHSASEAGAAADADYVVFGTTFVSRSKPAGAPVQGVEALAAAAAAATAPVLAIGGITPERARQCRGAGAAGVAAIGLFLPPGRAPGALGPVAGARALRAAWAD